MILFVLWRHPHLVLASMVPTPLCMPYDPELVRATPGMHVMPEGYLKVTLGMQTIPSLHPPPPNRYKPVCELAHRLVAGATHGANWHTRLQLAFNPSTRFEVSHTCGNAWCLCGAHMRVVQGGGRGVNTITMPWFKPDT
jgi:hypothetical protein